MVFIAARDNVRADLGTAIQVAMTYATMNVMRWGIDDCGLWIAEPIRNVLGYDIAADYRDRYHSRAGVLRILGKKGLIGAFRIQAQRHGWKQINPMDAQTGDVGYAILPVESGKRLPSCMICNHPGWFVGRNENGFTALSPSYVSRAWSLCL